MDIVLVAKIVIILHPPHYREFESIQRKKKGIMKKRLRSHRKRSRGNVPQEGATTAITHSAKKKPRNLTSWEKEMDSLQRHLPQQRLQSLVMVKLLR